MASNTFGKVLRITTWGESHGPAIGVVIDGFPAGVRIDETEIQAAMGLRAPGGKGARGEYVSPRQEADRAEILSGWFEGQTTGAPISLRIVNRDADSSKYEPIKDVLRPGHANFTYLEKYGLFDHRGGGRASARETACRVAAGTFAKKFLSHFGIDVVAYLTQMGDVAAGEVTQDMKHLRKEVYESALFCPEKSAEEKMKALLEGCMAAGDSIGGIVEFKASCLPAGLGDPVYQKLEAELAYALMGLPASKGFEIGSGFGSVVMRGSEHNDEFHIHEGKTKTKTNFSGGVLGGISNGMMLEGRVAFKPASSIKISQTSVTTRGESSPFNLPEGSRHDPCVAIRAVPVVEAMVALVIADALLLNRCAKL